MAGTLIIVALLVVSQFSPRWSAAKAAARARATEARVRLAQARALIRLADAVQDSATARAGRARVLEDSLFGAPSAGAAAGQLAGLLAEMAADASVEARSVVSLPDTTRAAGLTRIAARALLEGDIQGTAVLLAAIDNAPKLLRYREIAIMTTNAGAAEDRSYTLRTELVVESLARVGVGR